jgi:hypothetical protein
MEYCPKGSYWLMSITKSMPAQGIKNAKVSAFHLKFASRERFMEIPPGFYPKYLLVYHDFAIW